MSEHTTENDAPVGIAWRGVDGVGRARTGFAMPDDVPAFIEDKFTAGWRSLQVSSRGEVVGMIERRNGRRTWWAEADRLIPPAWNDDPNHPEGVDCHGYPLSSGERCGRNTHRVFTPETGQS